MNMHGDQWSCVYPDLDQFGEERLPGLLEDLPALHFQAWTDPQKIPEGKVVNQLVVLSENQGCVRHSMVVLGHADLKQSFLFSAFPVATDGVEVDLRVVELVPDAFGVEGTVATELPEGGSLTFFDPFFFFNQGRYRLGEINRVRLAAFAYDVRPMKREYLEIEDPERAAVLRAQLNIPVDQPVRFSMEDFVARIPANSEDNCSFASPIKDLVSLNVNGLELLRATVAFARGDDDLDGPLYFGRHICEGQSPEVGRMVQGAYWMQGYLVDTFAILSRKN